MKYTLITGASAGIGRELAHTFASKGHNIIIVARREESLNEIKAEINAKYDVEVIVKSADLSSSEAAEKLYADLKQYDLEVMFNNAGFGDIRPIWESTIEKNDGMVQLNIAALTTLSTLFVRDYKNTDAQLLNVSSVVGYQLNITANVYSATKFYVSALTEAMSIALKREGSKMQAKVLAPAVTVTEFANVALDNTKNTVDEMYAGAKKFHTAKEMADFGYKLYESDQVVGRVNRETYEFELTGPLFEALN